MTELEKEFSNILGKLVITVKQRDSMEVGCVGICVAVAPSRPHSTYNVIVKHIDFVKDSNLRTVLHSVDRTIGASKYTWIADEENNNCKDWFYVYNIKDLSLLTND